jgi:hypothetical protein
LKVLQRRRCENPKSSKNLLYSFYSLQFCQHAKFQGALQNGAPILDIQEARTIELLVILITEYKAHILADFSGGMFMPNSIKIDKIFNFMSPVIGKFKLLPVYFEGSLSLCFITEYYDENFLHRYWKKH